MSLSGGPFDPCIFAAGQGRQVSDGTLRQQPLQRAASAAFQTVTVKAYVERLDVVLGGHVIARHPRSYGRHEQSSIREHYLETLDRQPGGAGPRQCLSPLATAAAVRRAARGSGEAARAATRVKHYVRVLHFLARASVETVQRAIEQSRTEAGYDVEAHLAAGAAPGRCSRGDAPPPLDLSEQPEPVRDVARAVAGPAASLTNSCPRERRSMSEANTLLLKANLKQLRLPTMHAEFAALAREAATANENYEQYLLRLTELEVAARAANVLKARIKQAGFPVLKDFDSYDFTAQPSLPKPKVLELARGRVDRSELQYLPGREFRNGQNAPGHGLGLGGLPARPAGAVLHGRGSGESSGGGAEAVPTRSLAGRNWIRPTC